MRCGREFRLTVAGIFRSDKNHRPKNLSIPEHTQSSLCITRLRRGRELNPRMSVLQTEALPLRHHAIETKWVRRESNPHPLSRQHFKCCAYTNSATDPY